MPLQTSWRLALPHGNLVFLSPSRQRRLMCMAIAVALPESHCVASHGSVITECTGRC
jgi:hypothetical protein